MRGGEAASGRQGGGAKMILSWKKGKMLCLSGMPIRITRRKGAKKKEKGGIFPSPLFPRGKQKLKLEASSSAPLLRTEREQTYGVQRIGSPRSGLAKPDRGRVRKDP